MYVFLSKHNMIFPYGIFNIPWWCYPLWFTSSPFHREHICLLGAQRSLHSQITREIRSLTTQGTLLNGGDKIPLSHSEGWELIFLRTCWLLCCLWRQTSLVFCYRGSPLPNCPQWWFLTLPSLGHYPSLEKMSQVLYGPRTSMLSQSETTVDSRF